MRPTPEIEEPVDSEPRFRMQGGIPVIVHTGPVRLLTSDLVRKLAEDE
jgi:hypothetical protein